MLPRLALLPEKIIHLRLWRHSVLVRRRVIHRSQLRIHPARSTIRKCGDAETHGTVATSGPTQLQREMGCGPGATE